MRVTRRRALLGVMLYLAAPMLVVSQLAAQAHHVSGAPPSTSTASGRMRWYFIAADEVDWTYVPARGDQALTGKKDDFPNDPGARGMLDPNASTYRKALFREYTDSTFRTLKPRDEAWAHLGILGPLLRAEVGDTIRVVLRNRATRAYSLHPHGVFYRKDSEGTPYLDETSGADKLDDAVSPGGTYVYTWPSPFPPSALATRWQP